MMNDDTTNIKVQIAEQVAKMEAELLALAGVNANDMLYMAVVNGSLVYTGNSQNVYTNIIGVYYDWSNVYSFAGNSGSIGPITQYWKTGQVKLVSRAEFLTKAIGEIKTVLATIPDVEATVTAAAPGDSLKGLPLGELKVIAVAIVEFDAEAGENGETTVEMDILPGCEAIWEKLSAPPKGTVKCACCGHGLKYACAVLHVASNVSYWVGRECARKITGLRNYLGLCNNASVALAERLACEKREVEYLAAHPAAAPVIAEAKTSTLSIVTDMLAKLRKFGSLSDKQIETMAKCMAQDKARRAAATGTAPVGRQTVTGTVTTIKEVPNKFKHGNWDADTIAKMVVDLGNGVRVYGTKPESAVINKNDSVTFTATFEASDKDPLFGFFKRPSKLTVVNSSTPEMNLAQRRLPD